MKMINMASEIIDKLILDLNLYCEEKRIMREKEETERIAHGPKMGTEEYKISFPKD